MTTAAPLTGRATDVCRVTIEAPGNRADLSVPVTTPVSVLLPALLRQLPSSAASDGTVWVLQRLGEQPLDPEATPEKAGLQHGDVLHLRPADEPLPTIHFDDIADGVAGSVDDGPGRWRPELTRRITLGAACLALVGLAATLLGAGPGPRTAIVAVAVALVLAAACASMARMRADQGSILVAGLGAFSFAGGAGVILSGLVGGHASGLISVLFGAGSAIALAGVLFALRALPLVVPGTVLLAVVAAASTAGLSEGFGLRTYQSAAVVAVALFVLGHMAPRLALRTARLRVPQLPHDAQELQEDIEPVTGTEVSLRVPVATACLDTISVTSGLVWAVALWLLTAHEHGWAGWLLPSALSLSVLLRARNTNGTLQRVPAVLTGTYGLALILIMRTAQDGTAGRGVALVMLLASVVLLLVGAWRLPRARLLPIWGHLGDLLEMITAIALLPLLLQVLNAYAYFRGLAS
ncbi:type VII secretion integral membrane protein EccD (plasmid) [Streptomyces sp. NBC_01527]|uniref:type VII secretion integral membrane protein EccD n=1 Tax=unclassified Streptomyces TaxID=2593676 RepID=UPI002E107747|nr:type VII secretion integral membrane protein EccD [Streptomyces sp. NBC_01230]